MAMPAYVLVFVVLGQYGVASPLQSNLFGEGLQIPGLRSPARRDRDPHRRPLPVRLRARPQRVPRPVPSGPRSGAVPRAELRAGGAPRRGPPGSPGAGGRRVAGGDGGARRLRHRRPARRPGADERHLPGVVRDLRPGLRAAARHRAGRPRPDAGHLRAGACAGGPATTRPSAAATPSRPGPSAAPGAGSPPCRDSSSCWWRSRCPSPSWSPGRSRRSREATSTRTSVARRGTRSSWGCWRRPSPSSPRRSSPSASAPTARTSGRPVPASRPSATPCRAPSSRSRCTSRWSASTGGSPTGPRMCWVSTPA